jgi:hypothetical protein
MLTTSGSAFKFSLGPVSATASMVWREAIPGAGARMASGGSLLEIAVPLHGGTVWFMVMRAGKGNAPIGRVV